jgi:hypothetical protein
MCNLKVNKTWAYYCKVDYHTLCSSRVRHGILVPRRYEGTLLITVLLRSPTERTKYTYVVNEVPPEDRYACILYIPSVPSKVLSKV